MHTPACYTGVTEMEKATDSIDLPAIGAFLMSQAIDHNDDAIDLFEDMESLPEEVQALCDQMAEEVENDDGNAYMILKGFLPRFEAQGYTFEYGLDGVPYDLRKLA